MEVSSTTLCPYCGHASANPKECERCRGVFEPLSRQASQNAMGPWEIRDEVNPFRPGCSYGTMKLLVSRGRVTAGTVLRGPSTRQFWMYAKSVPGVAHLLGECHSCHKPASPNTEKCGLCGASFGVEEDRQYLGLAEMRTVPVMRRAEGGGRKAEGRQKKAGTEQVFAPASMPEAEAMMDLTSPERGAPDVRPIGELVPDDPDLEGGLGGPGVPVEIETPAAEPVRLPARAERRESANLSDEQIEALLKKDRGPERARRGAPWVLWVVIAAVLGMGAVAVVAILLVTQGVANRGGAGGAGAPVTRAPK